MIRLNVTTFNGLPVSQPLSAQFDEMGGDIGRADTNQLVLPDPERTISRVHARVLFRANSGFGIVDQGSNAISGNGIQLHSADNSRSATLNGQLVDDGVAVDTGSSRALSTSGPQFGVIR
eukprot:gene17848-21835_t